MYSEIRIGDKTVPMMAMASIDVYYKRIFREDPMEIQTRDQDMASQIDMTMKLGYVMAKFFELKTSKEMSKLNEDTYLDWLDQFPREDYLNALEDIRKVYEGQKIGTATQKKDNGE